MLRAAFGKQLFGQRTPLRNIVPYQFLHPFDGLPGRKDTYFPVFQTQNNLIAYLQAQCLAILSGDDNAATFSQFCPYLKHMSPRDNLSYMPLEGIHIKLCHIHREKQEKAFVARVANGFADEDVLA